VLGKPGFPPKKVDACFVVFIIEPVVFIGARFKAEFPSRGTRANVLLWKLMSRGPVLGSNQWVLPEGSFIVLYLVTGKPDVASSPKQSVSCASFAVVLFVQESLRVVFIVGRLLIIVVVPNT
jgi:hypothetical protein